MKAIVALLAAAALLDTSGPRRDSLLPAKWEKFHGTNIPDTWGVEAGREILWHREAGADGGSAGVRQDLRIDVARRLVLECEVRVDAHSLGGSGWWSDQHGQTGEYPVKVQIAYLDAKEKAQLWAHGFLTADNPQKLRNYTKVRAGEWTKVKLDVDLGGPATLRQVALCGIGWTFKGGVRNVRLTAAR